LTALARWLSIVGHPFVMALIMAGATSLRSGSWSETLTILALVGVLALAPVALLMRNQVRKGAWSNIDASDRKERPVLFGVGIAGVVALLGAAFVLRPQSFLIRGTVGVLAMLAVCAISSKWIKVSLHSAFGALAAATLLLIGSAVGWALLAFLPFLVWSRLALGRHTTREVVAGLLVGVISA
jgi:membrane-associated phospholipid phosphatase